jgi:heme/copper-type cytochrome/quinol oxidase subunit 1
VRHGVLLSFPTCLRAAICALLLALGPKLAFADPATPPSVFNPAASGTLAIAGLEALLMRVQLATPRNDFLDPETFNQMFTMHGTTMVFFLGMPILFGFANYLVPLMIGASDMAFPRLNALSYWLFLFGGVLVYWSFLAGGAPDQMWMMYPPLTLEPFATNTGPTFCAAGLLVSSVGSIATAVNLIVTIAALRAPGLDWTRLPMFCWTTFCASAIAIWALPPPPYNFETVPIVRSRRPLWDLKHPDQPDER